ncbi:MAG TPA: hypothetical protein VMT39_00700 [Candidatus Bathyarchaeia archaeon]|nr:hypothetical protein [Candidatus Bathyarchaeia archaeon]
MSDMTIHPTIQRKQTSPLMYFLVFISLIFIGILIFVYSVTKRTHPVYVDERGNPVNAEADHHDSGGGHSQ